VPWGHFRTSAFAAMVFRSFQQRAADSEALLRRVDDQQAKIAARSIDADLHGSGDSPLLDGDKERVALHELGDVRHQGTFAGAKMAFHLKGAIHHGNDFGDVVIDNFANCGHNRIDSSRARGYFGFALRHRS
jgi:hypothetical protein